MNVWTGKRTERMRIPLQINVDPEMSKHIKDRATRRMRPIGSELVRLIAIGLSHDDEATVHDLFLMHAQEFAPPRKVTHTDARKQEKAS